MEVCTGHAQLLDLVRIVDEAMNEFLLETFYKVTMINCENQTLCTS